MHGLASNPYPSGIPRRRGPANQLHVTLDPGVNVTLPGPGIAVALNNFGNSVPVFCQQMAQQLMSRRYRLVRREQGALRRDPGERRHDYGVGPN